MRIGQRADDRSDARVVLEIVCQRDIDEDGVLDVGEDAPDERRVKSAPEVADPFAGKAPDVASQRSGRKPNAEPVDRRLAPCFAVRLRPRPRGQRLKTIPCPLRLWRTSLSSRSRCSSTSSVTPGQAGNP